MFSSCRQSMLSGFLHYSRNYSLYTKVYPIVKHTIKFRNGPDYKNYLAIHNYLINDSFRRYSKKSDEKSGDEKTCKPQRVQECTPIIDCDKKQLPYLQECARPNLMSDCPKPECRVDDEQKDNTNILLLALLGLAASLAALYYFVNQGDRKQSSSITCKKSSLLLKDAPEMGEPCKPPFKDPKQSSEIPSHVPYLIIGAGTAAYSAFRAIKTCDPTAKVLMVGDEEMYPYMRPPLSKEMWLSESTTEHFDFKQWNGNMRSLFYEPSDFYLGCQDLMASENGGISVARGWSVSHLDVANKKAILDDGHEIGFNKVLIATGSLPKQLKILESADDCVKCKVTSYRTAKDFQCINNRLKDVKSVTIVGGGFLGCELSSSLARKAKQGNNAFTVNHVFRESGPMSSILPQYLTAWTKERLEEDGVVEHASSEIVAIESCDKSIQLKLNNGKSLTSELVIMVVGSKPNTQLAKASCLEVDPDLGGYLVNTELQARTNVYVAGDAACYYDPCYGRRRIEHHDNAVISGRLAGENMTGAAKPYLHQSMFWSDIGSEISFEAVGIVHSSLPTVGVFAKASKPPENTASDPVVDAAAVKEVPTECMQYLPKEEEERIQKAKAEKEEQLRKAEEEKQRLEAERAKALEKMKTQEYKRGVIFYLKDDIVVGILLWNVFNKMTVARQVLKDRCKYDDLNEVAKLFKIHEED